MNEYEQNNSSYGKPETRSRKFWRVVFGSMLGFFFSMILVSILYMVMLISMIGTLASASKETTTIKNNSVLQLNLNQSVAERVIETPFDKFNTYNAQIGLNDILACIKNAATDPKIKGIYLNSATVGASPASVKEIHDALVEFKKYGKFIYAYSDVLAQNGYYLASVADKIILNPAGSLDFKGYAFQVMFYKGLIDKLDVDVQILRHGQFKSAVEPYILDKMSEANREQLTVLSNSLWKVFVDDISAARKIPADSLNAIAENLLCATPEDALRLKMVDQLGYPGDMEKLLKSKLNVGEDDDINFVSISKYKKSIIENTKAAAKIAVALKAEKFVQLTNVPGVLRDVKDPSSLIKRIARDAIPSMIATGIISSGMIPKIECCFEALKGGVPRTHIIDGRVPHSLLIEMFSDRGVGTMIL